MLVLVLVLDAVLAHREHAAVLPVTPVNDRHVVNLRALGLWSMSRRPADFNGIRGS
jgi:hypothetical protein